MDAGNNNQSRECGNSLTKRVSGPKEVKEGGKQDGQMERVGGRAGEEKERAETRLKGDIGGSNCL